MEDLRLLVFDKFNIKYLDVKKEDWDELIWDFENLILDGKQSTFMPYMAENLWLAEVKNLTL